MPLPTHLLLYSRKKLDHVIEAVEAVIELLGRVLGEMRDPEIPVATDLTAQRPQLVQDEVQEGGLPRSVGADDAYPRLEVHSKVNVREQRFRWLVTERNAFDLPTEGPRPPTNTPLQQQPHHKQCGKKVDRRIQGSS